MAAQLAVHWLALRVERIRVRQPERKQQNFKLSFRMDLEYKVGGFSVLRRSRGVDSMKDFRPPPLPQRGVRGVAHRPRRLLQRPQTLLNTATISAV